MGEKIVFPMAEDIYSNLVGFRSVCNETDALNLTNIVESDDADKSTRVSLNNFIELLQYLRSVGGAKHGKLPHCPVPSIIVSW
jgi:hypothetical protein